MKRDLATSLGWLIQQARKRRGWTVSELASASGVDFLAVKAVEEEGNLDRETLLRVSEALRDDVESGRDSFPCLRIEGGATLSGTIEVKASKNASVALLCASLLNRGRTTIRKKRQIVDVQTGKGHRVDLVDGCSEFGWVSRKIHQASLTVYRRVFSGSITFKTHLRQDRQFYL